MISRWNQFPLDVPFDGQLIWCRIDRWVGQPFLATFNLATMQVTSFVNGLTYDFWMISAWQDADPIPSVPVYPIVGINNPDSLSAVSSFEINNLLWQLSFSLSSPAQITDDFAVQISVCYAAASMGNPPLPNFSYSLVLNLKPGFSDTAYVIWGSSANSSWRYMLNSFIRTSNRILQSGFRLFCRYRIIHRPTGFAYPWQIESVQVT